MIITYELSDISDLDSLYGAALGHEDNEFRYDKFILDLRMYRTYCHKGELYKAGRALNDARDDLFVLLEGLDSGFAYEDADFMLDMYIPEYMDGWQY